jgi:hypothetical protein
MDSDPLDHRLEKHASFLPARLGWFNADQVKLRKPASQVDDAHPWRGVCQTGLATRATRHKTPAYARAVDQTATLSDSARAPEWQSAGRTGRGGVVWLS